MIVNAKIKKFMKKNPRDELWSERFNEPQDMGKALVNEKKWNCLP